MGNLQKVKWITLLIGHKRIDEALVFVQAERPILTYRACRQIRVHPLAVLAYAHRELALDDNERMAQKAMTLMRELILNCAGNPNHFVSRLTGRRVIDVCIDPFLRTAIKRALLMRAEKELRSRIWSIRMPTRKRTVEMRRRRLRDNNTIRNRMQENEVMRGD